MYSYECVCARILKASEQREEGEVGEASVGDRSRPWKQGVQNLKTKRKNKMIFYSLSKLYVPDDNNHTTTATPLSPIASSGQR